MPSAGTHTALAATGLGKFSAIQVPTETPGAGEILLKVAASSMIAFDTYVTDLGYYVQDYPLILGFNASGTVAKVGEGVTSLKEGDRVTAFSFGASRNKGMQQYTIQPVVSCAKIPDSMDFAAAATIPDNFITAFYTLFNQLGLQVPDAFPANTPPAAATTPILIYGAGSTAGQYAIQLLATAGYTKIIATASSSHHAYLRSLGATDVFDYKSPSLVEDVAKAAGGDGKATLAVDCITSMGTLETISKMVSRDGTVALLLPIKEGASVRGAEGTQMFMELPKENPLPKGTKHVGVRTFTYQSDEFLRDQLMPRILPELLRKGLIQPNRVKLLDQGTLEDRVSLGLDLLRNNAVSGEKIVVKFD